MKVIEKLFDDYNELSYIEKVDLGKQLYSKIIAIMDDNDIGNFFITSQIILDWFITFFCDIDVETKQLQYQYYNDITMKELLKKFLSELTNDEIENFKTLAVLFLSLDYNCLYKEKISLINLFK